MPKKSRSRLTQRKGKDATGRSTKRKISTVEPGTSKSPRVESTSSTQCLSITDFQPPATPQGANVRTNVPNKTNELQLGRNETELNKQVPLQDTQQKTIVSVTVQQEASEQLEIEARTSPNSSSSSQQPVHFFPEVEIIYPNPYSDSDYSDEESSSFKPPLRKSKDIIREQKAGIMRGNFNFNVQPNNRQSYDEERHETNETSDIRCLTETFQNECSILNNKCCCSTAAPASMRCPVHERENETLQNRQQIVDNQQQTSDNQQEVFETEREMEIFADHVVSPTNIFDFEDIGDDAPIDHVVPVPIHDDDDDRQNRLNEARNNDLLDLQARRIEIERVRNRITQLRTYLQATDLQVQTHRCGPMNQQCPYCRAKFFLLEFTTDAKYSKCCANNKVRLNNLQEHPLELKQLFKGQHELSREFKSKILVYNNLFQFASMEANLRDIPGQGPYVYAIQGQMYHHYSDVNVARQNQKYGPVYFLDPDQAVEQRINNGEHFNVNRQLIRLIGDVMQRNNPFAQQYRSLYQQYERQAVRMAQQNIRVPRVYLEFVAAHRRRREYDNPQVEEIAAICEYNEEAPPNPRMRVFLTNQDNGLRTIDNQSEYIDPLVFPLLFPCGDLGWHSNIPLNNQRQGGRQRVTLSQYYSYRLAIRIDDNNDEDFDVFRYCGKLLQKYVVSAFLRIEANRINFVRTNQNRLRAEEYQGLVDYVHHRGQQENIPIGRMIILPSSFEGGPRSQLQRFQDSMAVVMKMGHPSLFITMTCNPNWPEIRENLAQGDEPSNNPLLVCRVFQMKLNQLMHDLSKNHVMGVCVAFICVIEFQKRGLPHAHILITLRNEDKLLDDIRIDDLISAELPDPETHPELFQLVSKHMIHGPCGPHNPGSVCMQDNRCSKHFPKFWYNHTTIRDGKVNYRRRNDGRQAEVRRGNRVYVVDNSFVVPYNPYLLLKYETHINVEAVAGTMSVKYVYKYFFKGPDRALLRIVGEAEDQQIQYDEISSYVNGRYITAPESAWRILQFHMHNNSHHVERLQIHLPNRQSVVFQQGHEEDAVNVEHRTQLTEWFETNRNDPFARQFTYLEFPQHFTWNRNTKRWTQRRRVTSPIVSRMYTVSVRSGELYYLRLLLLHVKGCTSFDDVKTVNGTVCDTFQDACRQKDLLLEDQEWIRSLTEASAKDMPIQLRQMFAYILLYGTVEDPPALWARFRAPLIEDFVRRRGLNEADAEIAALRKIQFILAIGGRRLSDFGLNDPPEDDVQVFDEPIDIMEERRRAENMLDRLNADQRAVFDSIMAAVENENEPRRLFFVTGTAGTGKTYLYNTLITHMIARQHQVISIAWTGLAASLLKQGRTVHSRFQLPVPTAESSTSRISAQSRDAQLLRESRLIIWDEVSMSTRIVFNLVDKTLRFLCNNDAPFGGKVVVIGGDFKQCLPVVNDGDRTAVVEACIKSSLLWHLFEPLELRINMRVEPDEQEFIAWLNQLGNGTLPTLAYGNRRGIVQIPRHCVVDTQEQLIRNIFGNLKAGDVPNRAILTPLNSDCFQINDRILDGLIDVPERVYFSVDTVVTDDPVEANRVQIEHLNSCTPTGLPPHRLRLKRGTIVMLLRNLNVRQNLCNGTRLLVHDLANHHIEAETINFDGQLSGIRVFIPRIDFLTTDNNSLPFVMRRRQFPLRISYAITINKSQGQTFESVGIYLPNAVFEHGQLFVAFSRAKTAKQVFVCVSENAQQGRLCPDNDSTYTRNIVYKEIL